MTSSEISSESEMLVGGRDALQSRSRSFCHRLEPSSEPSQSWPCSNSARARNTLIKLSSIVRDDDDDEVDSLLKFSIRAMKNSTNR